MTIAAEPLCLLAAVRRGDEKTALHLLVTGCHGDVDAIDDDLRDGSALFWAASRGMGAVARKLIALGADLSLRAGTLCTPLHAAADSGQPKLIKILLRAGADVRLQNVNGSTPAHLAAFRGHLECLRILLHAGSDIMARDYAGKTVYIYGILNGDAGMKELVQEMRKCTLPPQEPQQSLVIPERFSNLDSLRSHSSVSVIQSSNHNSPRTIHISHMTDSTLHVNQERSDGDLPSIERYSYGPSLGTAS